MKPDFETLAEQHSHEIYVYLWRMLGDTQDAEDCLQDTFLRAYKAYKRLDEKANTRAWLYKIATNVARTHLKKRSRTTSRTSDLDPQLLGQNPNLDINLDTAQQLEEVSAAVQLLPEKQQAALMMRKYQELSYPEIATALKTSEESARANVYQALKKLRKQFAAQVQVTP
ncbi:MAG: RNA polymerase sigma factor [Chloroflexi bacterium]|nr:MAG: RNA polymerase sigma factor [Chloroflexota bacterium]MBL1196559.1 RNA polymerase sigma factor [Chloroflexota bacterium]NOH13854.1 RNA polymerase sigma factor [Chloroflexota bacterium]